MSVTLFSIVFRILVALFTQSYFQPDEYFQALEPAHRYVFGYGHLTWEWVNPQPLRCMLYPSLNIPVYWLLKISGLDVYPTLMVAGPRILHGLLAALTDVWVPKLASIILDDASNKGTSPDVADYAVVAYLLSITSFFHSLSLSRSLSNSIEVSITTIALAYFPWDVLVTPFLVDLPKLRPKLRRSILFAGVACAIRPTNAIIWVYMFSLLLWRVRGNTKLLLYILWDAACSGSTVLLVVFTLDTLFYERPTLTLLNFLLINASPVSSFYGSSPWHYYLLQAFPIMCTTALPFVLHGLWLAFAKPHFKLRIMAGCIVWTVLIYSLIGHKEWRFLHPLLPMMHVLAAQSITQLVHSQEIGSTRLPSVPATWNRPQFLIPLVLSLSIPASVYVVFFHCTGQIGVMSFLRQIPVDDSTTIGFLMPCHSTPWQAYLHRPDLAQPGKMWALGCEPPLGLQNHTEYRDQTDIFFESPISYIKTHFPTEIDLTFPLSPFAFSVPNATFIQALKAIEIQSGSWDLGWRHEWPRYIVFFGALLEEPGIRSLFGSQGYVEVWNGGWQWEGEGKRKGGVRVWVHSGSVRDISSKSIPI